MDYDIIQYNTINIGSPKVCGWIWFLSNELYVFYDMIENIQQTMGDSFYHMLQHHYVDLSENDVDLLDIDVHLSDIKLTSRWQLVASTQYKYNIFSY